MPSPKPCPVCAELRAQVADLTNKLFELASRSSQPQPVVPDIPAPPIQRLPDTVRVALVNNGYMPGTEEYANSIAYLESLYAVGKKESELLGVIERESSGDHLLSEDI